MFKIPPSSALSTRNQQIVPCIINGKFLQWMLSLNFGITTDFSATYTTAKVVYFFSWKGLLYLSRLSSIRDFNK